MQLTNQLISCILLHYYLYHLLIIFNKRLVSFSLLVSSLHSQGEIVMQTGLLSFRANAENFLLLHITGKRFGAS